MTNYRKFTAIVMMAPFYTNMVMTMQPGNSCNDAIGFIQRTTLHQTLVQRVKQKKNN